MEIADPIYDAAFKYLMQDDRAARLLVGRIAELGVEALELRPREVIALLGPPGGAREAGERTGKAGEGAGRAGPVAVHPTPSRPGTDADAIAGALSIDVSEVRRVLTEDDGGDISS